MARKSMDFEKIIGAGENARGFTAQTPNGTAHATGTGFNRRQPFSRPQISESDVWPAGRSNRTGE